MALRLWWVPKMVPHNDFVEFHNFIPILLRIFNTLMLFLARWALRHEGHQQSTPVAARIASVEALIVGGVGCVGAAVGI